MKIMHKSQIKRHTNTISLDIYLSIYCISYMFNIYDYLLFYICDSLLLQVLIFILILSRHFLLLFDDDDLPPSLLYINSRP